MDQRSEALEDLIQISQPMVFLASSGRPWQVAPQIIYFDWQLFLGNKNKYFNNFSLSLFPSPALTKQYIEYMAEKLLGDGGIKKKLTMSDRSIFLAKN